MTTQNKSIQLVLVVKYLTHTCLEAFGGSFLPIQPLSFRRDGRSPNARQHNRSRNIKRTFKFIKPEISLITVNNNIFEVQRRHRKQFCQSKWTVMIAQTLPFNRFNWYLQEPIIFEHIYHTEVQSIKCTMSSNVSITLEQYKTTPQPRYWSLKLFYYFIPTHYYYIIPILFKLTYQCLRRVLPPALFWR